MRALSSDSSSARTVGLLPWDRPHPLRCSIHSGLGPEGMEAILLLGFGGRGEFRKEGRKEGGEGKIIIGEGDSMD